MGWIVAGICAAVLAGTIGFVAGAILARCGGLGRDIRRLEEELARTKDPAHKKELQSLLHDWKEKQYMITGYIVLAAFVILCIIIYLTDCIT